MDRSISLETARIGVRFLECSLSFSKLCVVHALRVIFFGFPIAPPRPFLCDDTKQALSGRAMAAMSHCLHNYPPASQAFIHARQIRRFFKGIMINMAKGEFSGQENTKCREAFIDDCRQKRGPRPATPISSPSNATECSPTMKSGRLTTASEKPCRREPYSSYVKYPISVNNGLLLISGPSVGSFSTAWIKGATAAGVIVIPG
jgi:hypothetical protein